MVPDMCASQMPSFVCRTCVPCCSMQAPDAASGEAAPFQVMLTTYGMYERDSNDARVDRAFLSK